MIRRNKHSTGKPPKLIIEANHFTLQMYEVKLLVKQIETNRPQMSLGEAISSLSYVPDTYPQYSIVPTNVLSLSSLSQESSL